MTISSTGREARSPCNGVTTIFGVPYQFAEGGLSVSMIDDTTDALTELVEGVDFSLAGDGKAGTASIHTATAYPAGKTLWSRRDTPRLQQQAYTANDGFPAASHEASLDHQVMMIQEIGDDLATLGDRALLVPAGLTAGPLPDPSLHAGQVLTAGPGGSWVFSTMGGADAALRADLAANGNARVGYISPITGAVARPLGDKLGEMLSFGDGAVVSDGSTPDSDRLAVLIGTMPIARTLYGFVGSNVRNDSGWSQSRYFDWDLDHDAVMLSNQASPARAHVLAVNITRTAAGLKIPFQEVRGMRIHGGQWATNATSGGGVDGYGAGGYAIAVNIDPAGRVTDVNPTGGYYGQVGLLLDGVQLRGGLGAIYMGGDGVNDCILFSGAINCPALENGAVLSKVSDGSYYRNNLCFGTNPAFWLDARDGAFNHMFADGSCVNQRGALFVYNGSHVTLDNVQIEHSSSNPGPNDSQFLSMVTFFGHDYVGIGNAIERCNIGMGQGALRGVALINQHHAVIDRVQFGPPKIDTGSGAVVGSDVLLGATTDIGLKLPAHTVIGLRNTFRGNRVRQPSGTFTDPSRQMLIELAATPDLIPGTKNIWHPGVSIFRSLAGGWSCGADLELMFLEHGECVMQGSFTGGATTGNIATVVSWLPLQTDQHLIAVSNGVPCVLKLDHTTRVLSITGTLGAAAIDMAPARFMAITDTPHDIGAI